MTSFHQFSPRIPVALFLLFWLCPALLMAAEAPTINNPNQPRHGSIDLHLEEVWRAGSEDDDLFFGMITQVREDTNGNLFVMDAQLSQVQVFSPAGQHLKTLFREGEGPGEIRGPRDMVLLNDGRIGLVQEVPGKLVFVDREGNPAGMMGIGGDGTSHGGFCQTFSAFTDGQQLLVAGFVQKPGDAPGTLTQTSFLSGFDPQGHPTVEFAKRDNLIVFSDFVFDETKHLAPFWWNAAVGDDGLVYVAPQLDEYKIEVRNPDGTLVRTIERQYEPWQRSAQDKKHFINMVEAIYHGMPVQVKVQPMAVEPVILYLNRGLRVRPDGSIWVLTTRGVREPAGDSMATFDVFDAQGIFDRQVNIHGPWNGMTDGILLVDHQHAVIVTGFADAMATQFTGGNMSVEIEGEAGTVEVIYCKTTSD